MRRQTAALCALCTLWSFCSSVWSIAKEAAAHRHVMSRCGWIAIAQHPPRTHVPEEGIHAVPLPTQIPGQWTKYLLPKGFVAVDGCSLTVGSVQLSSRQVLSDVA